jgi:hypothetical protein
MKNPVAKNNNEFNKPKTFRDRKKHPSKKQQRQERAEKIHELHHPQHEPYERPTKGELINTLLGDWDAL